MACNCLCCGCQNCTEGQEGKCCCGGPTGECCQAGYFCCDGVCLEGGCEACTGTCSDTEPCETGCGCVYTGSRLNSDGDFGTPGDGKPPDPYTPDPGDTAGECCVGAAVYSVRLDENNSFDGWDLLSDDCPAGYSPPEGGGEPAIFYAVACCVENTFP